MDSVDEEHIRFSEELNFIVARFLPAVWFYMFLFDSRSTCCVRVRYVHIRYSRRDTGRKFIHSFGFRSSVVLFSFFIMQCIIGIMQLLELKFVQFYWLYLFFLAYLSCFKSRWLNLHIKWYFFFLNLFNQLPKFCERWSLVLSVFVNARKHGDPHSIAKLGTHNWPILKILVFVVLSSLTSDLWNLRNLF